MALNLPLRLLSLYIRYHVSNKPAVYGIVNLPRGIIDVPVAVAWIRLGVNGPRSVARRGFYPFGRLERRFLLAEILLAFVSLVFAVIGGLLITVGFVNGTHHLPVLARAVAVLLGTGIVALLFPFAVRFSLALVAVALQRYTGLRAVWQLGKGATLRMIGIGFLVLLPFGIAQAIFDTAQSYLADSVWIILPVMLFVVCEQLANAASAGSLAIVYRFATGAGQSSTPLAPADLQAK